MASKKEEKEQMDWKKSTVLYFHDLIRMLTVIVVVFLIFFRIVVVNGDSMYSTLLDGDYLLLVNNLFYPQPSQGDIVVISKRSFDGGSPIVKRVIATEGQLVDIDFTNGIVYVDGVPLEEGYINTLTTENEGMYFPLTVEENHLFVLGDNRGVSLDSRDPRVGQIDQREVLGKVIYLIFPGTSNGEMPWDKSRIGAIK